jgi:AcrR family transcriptional regulator
MPRARNAIRRRSPKQERSRRLVEAILEAAQLVLAESGPEALTTVNVARRAGVSVGSLYQYFAGRDALLFAIYEEELGRFRSAWRAWRTGGGARASEAAVREGVALALAHYRRLAALDPAFFLAHRAEIARGVAGAAGRSSARSRAARDAVAEFLLRRGIPGLLDAALEHAPALLSEPAFEAELATLAVAYWARARR